MRLAGTETHAYERPNEQRPIDSQVSERTATVRERDNPTSGKGPKQNVKHKVP